MTGWVHRQFHGDLGRQGHHLAQVAQAKRDGLAQLVKRQGISIPGTGGGDDAESAAGSAVESADDTASTAVQQATTSAVNAATSTRDVEQDASTALDQASSQIADTTSSTSQAVESSSSESSEESSIAITTESSSSSSEAVSSTQEESTETSTEIETTTSSRAQTSSTSPSSSEALTSSVPSRAEASESTNIHYITGSNSASASSTSSGDDDSPSTGAVIGIVAGGLVGAVVLAGILGYFFKAKCSNKDDEDELAEAAFNKDDFRRESVMLSGMDDDDRMSMRSASQAGSLSRAGTTMLPGLGRQNTVVPRPPSMFERHLYNSSPSPYQQNYGNMPMGQSYEPGQVVNTGQHYYAGSDGGWTPAGGYGQTLQPNYAGSQVGLARADTVASQYPDVADPIQRSGSAQSYYADLQRQASQASSHQRGPSSSLGSGESYQPAAPQPAHLAGIAEDDYALHRTGTLEDTNPQQTYFGNGQPQVSSGLKNPYDL